MEDKRNTIQIHPSNDGILVVYHSHDEMNLAPSDVKYDLFFVNEIPVLIFRFENPKEDFFIPINYPEILSAGNYTWLDKVKIAFFLKRFEMPDTLDKRKPIKIELSVNDSAKLKASCYNQVGESIEWIDAAIDYIYDNDFNDHEWLRKS